MPLSAEDVEDTQWKIVQLRPSEWPTGEGAAPDGFAFQENPFHPSLDGYAKIQQSELWQSMGKYTRCKIDSQFYATGDYVFVNYKAGESRVQVEVETPESNPKDFWVAKIIEIKAVDDSLVFARVVWFYWPEDLPMSVDNRGAAKGRRAYHGEHEIIASNYTDIVNVCAFAGIALVEQWIETDDEMELKGLYWRQLFDFRIKHLSKLRPHCVCSHNYNPDKLVLACPSCKVWLHEDCIIEATLRLKHQSVTPTSNTMATIQRKRKRRKRKCSKAKNAWLGLFKGQIMQSEDGQPPQVEVTDLRPGMEAEANCKHEIMCMSCGTKLE